jgi:hypothetical protein
MSNTNTETSPTEEYLMRVAVAALTKCKDDEQAVKLGKLGQALYRRIDEVIKQTGDLLDEDEVQSAQAITLLDEMIDQAEQLTRPSPVEAVREVCAYGMVRLYYQRAIVRFGASGTSNLKAALADLDIAEGYPTSTFAELDPEVLGGMRALRALAEAVLEGQDEGSSGSVSTVKSTGCLVLIAACGFAGLLGVILA